jgi:hypothetical protein
MYMLLMDDWLMHLMYDRLVLFMDNIFVNFFNNIFMMLMHNILMLLFDNGGSLMLLDDGCLFMMNDLSFFCSLSYFGCFSVLNDHGFLLEFVHNWFFSECSLACAESEVPCACGACSACKSLLLRLGCIHSWLL